MSTTEFILESTDNHDHEYGIDAPILSDPMTAWEVEDTNSSIFLDSDEYVDTTVDTFMSQIVNDPWDTTPLQDGEVTTLTQYGIFSHLRQDRSMREYFQVHLFERNNQQYINVGPIQINVDTLHTFCARKGCSLNMTLPSDTREEMEWSILYIFHHLGSHRTENTLYPYAPITKLPRLSRDEENVKVMDHLMRCFNSNCDHNSLYRKP